MEIVEYIKVFFFGWAHESYYWIASNFGKTVYIDFLYLIFTYCNSSWGFPFLLLTSARSYSVCRFFLHSVDIASAVLFFVSMEMGFWKHASYSQKTDRLRNSKQSRAKLSTKTEKEWTRMGERETKRESVRNKKKTPFWLQFHFFSLGFSMSMYMRRINSWWCTDGKIDEWSDQQQRRKRDERRRWRREKRK